MKLYAECISCMCASALKRAEAERDPLRRTQYMCKVCQILAAGDPERDSAPVLDARITRLRREYLGIDPGYAGINRRFNDMMLEIYDELRARVRASGDPLRAALQFSMVGNYIDFNMLSDVNPETALRLIDEASERALDEAELANLRADLSRGGMLAMIHDNCGEVVLDKLLIETAQWLQPGLRAISVVRGGPIANDVSRADAEQIGLGEVAEVFDNGQPDMPGTVFEDLPAPLRRRLEDATLIIAKGQGNFESLMGCGLNIYYLLLSKCENYTAWFGFEHMSGVLTNELRRGF